MLRVDMRHLVQRIFFYKDLFLTPSNFPTSHIRSLITTDSDSHLCTTNTETLSFRVQRTWNNKQYLRKCGRMVFKVIKTQYQEESLILSWNRVETSSYGQSLTIEEQKEPSIWHHQPELDTYLKTKSNQSYKHFFISCGCSFIFW